MKKGNKLLLVIIFGVVIGLLLTFLSFYLVFDIILMVSMDNNLNWEKQFNITLGEPINSQMIASNTNNFFGDGYEYEIYSYDDNGIKYVFDNNDWIKMDSPKLGYASQILDELKKSPEVSDSEKKSIAINYPKFDTSMYYLVKEGTIELDDGTSVVENRVVLLLDEKNKIIYEFGSYT